MEPCIVCGTATSLYYKGRALCIECDRKREQGKDVKEGQLPELPKRPPQMDSNVDDIATKTAGGLRGA